MADIVGDRAGRVSLCGADRSVLAGLLLSLGTLAIDRATGFDLIPRWLSGGPDAAMGILTTIAVSMVRWRRWC